MKKKGLRPAIKFVLLVNGMSTMIVGCFQVIEIWEAMLGSSVALGAYGIIEAIEKKTNEQ